jgi:DNA-binding transcriptional MocR family regulator
LVPTLEVVRRTYADRARVMARGLRRELGDAITFDEPMGGMFFWARLTQGRDAAEFARRAIDKLVAFVPGAPFFPQSPDPACLRLSFATADREKIEQGLARLGQAL